MIIIKEPIIGPKTGATELIAISIPINWVRAGPWNLSQAMDLDRTRAPEPANPWKNLQTIRTLMFAEIAHRNDINVKINIDTSNGPFLPFASEIGPIMH